MLIVTAPPVPPVAVPDPTSSDPVVLLLDDPELSTSMPDTPVVPASAVAIVTAPLELALPTPLVTASERCRWHP